jgi:two-component system osmolarity sensor histidine kinase EnvZ
MKLQLEMMAQSAEIFDLKQDISDMEKLVNEYLDFAKSDDKEKAVNVKIKKFLQEKVFSYYAKINQRIEGSLDLSDNFEIPIKKLAFKRALINLVDNAFNYGNRVEIGATLSENNLIITIQDDGPGIPASERNNVFKPFYRIDNSRNLDKKIVSSGSGLGLAIAMDSVTSHGGHIKLSDSKLGGLCVTIFIPV